MKKLVDDILFGRPSKCHFHYLSDEQAQTSGAIDFDAGLQSRWAIYTPIARAKGHTVDTSFRGALSAAGGKRMLRKRGTMPMMWSATGM